MSILFVLLNLFITVKIGVKILNGLNIFLQQHYDYKVKILFFIVRYYY